MVINLKGNTTLYYLLVHRLFLPFIDLIGLLKNDNLDFEQEMGKVLTDAELNPQAGKNLDLNLRFELNDASKRIDSGVHTNSNKL